MKRNWVFGFIIGILALMCGFLIIYSYQKGIPDQVVIEKIYDLNRLKMNQP